MTSNHSVFDCSNKTCGGSTEWENCNGICTHNSQPCNGICRLNTKSCGSDVCIPRTSTCNGKCLAGYIRCPSNAEKCLKANSICGLGVHFPSTEQDFFHPACPNTSIFSRDVCEHEGWSQISSLEHIQNDRSLQCLGQRRSQFIDFSGICNNFFDCMDRSDESGCRPADLESQGTLGHKMFRRWKEEIDNYPGLENADDDAFEEECKAPLVRCNQDECIDPKDLCGRSHACESYTNFDFTLCQNFSYWLAQPCAAEGERCTGNSPYSCKTSQFLLKWLLEGDDYSDSLTEDYETSDYFYDFDNDDDFSFDTADSSNETLWTSLLVHKSCEDNSDLIFPASQDNFCNLPQTWR